MSSYTEKEIISVAITIVDEFGEIDTKALRLELFDRMQPDGDDLRILESHGDESFYQKVRNMVSHSDTNRLSNYVDLDKSVRPAIFRSKKLFNEISSLPIPQQTTIIKDRKKRARHFTGRKLDHENYQKERSAIGSAGELFALEVEKGYINENYGSKYVSEVTHSSVINGDGLGYDILSFDDNGLKYIEVKTTKNELQTPFYMSLNERMFLELHAESYYLFRVYNFDITTGQGEIEFISGEQLLNDYDFETQSFRITHK